MNKKSMRDLLDLHQQISDGKTKASMYDIREAFDGGKSKIEIMEEFNIDKNQIDQALDHTAHLKDALSENEVKDWWKDQLSTIFTEEVNDMFAEPKDKGKCDDFDNQESFDCVDQETKESKKIDESVERQFVEGDKVRLIPPYNNEDPTEIFTVVDWDETKSKGRIHDDEGRGWFVTSHQIEPAELEEEWDTDYETPKSKQGMFDGKTKQELKSQLAKLKKSGPHQKGSPAYKKQNQLEFALRAKNDWGKVKEDNENPKSKDEVRAKLHPEAYWSDDSDEEKSRMKALAHPEAYWPEDDLDENGSFAPVKKANMTFDDETKYRTSKDKQERIAHALKVAQAMGVNKEDIITAFKEYETNPQHYGLEVEETDMSIVDEMFGFMKKQKKLTPDELKHYRQIAHDKARARQQKVDRLTSDYQEKGHDQATARRMAYKNTPYEDDLFADIDYDDEDKITELDLDEISSSEKQAKFMTANCKSPEFRKKTGMDKDVACDFHDEDKGTFHEGMFSFDVGEDVYTPLGKGKILDIKTKTNDYHDFKNQTVTIGDPTIMRGLVKHYDFEDEEGDTFWLDVSSFSKKPLT